jgi:hypothetical protein
VRYVSLSERIEAHELRLPVTVNAVSANEAAQAAPDDGVVEEIVVLKSARAQREARERAEEGDFDTAQKLLREAAEDLRKVAPDSPRAEELLTQAEETVRFAESMSLDVYDESNEEEDALQLVAAPARPPPGNEHGPVESAGRRRGRMRRRRDDGESAHRRSRSRSCHHRWSGNPPDTSRPS